MGRMFARLNDKKQAPKPVKKKRREAVCEVMKKMLSDWSLNRLDMTTVCKKSCALYDAMVYKFGKSNRRQKYWPIVRQIYNGLRRINRQPLVKSFEKFALVSLLLSVYG